MAEVRKKRRLKKSIKRATVGFLGIMAGLFLGLNSNAEAPITNLEVAEGTLKIEDYQYYREPSLIKVVLPKGITQIGYSAFEECIALKDINIPDTLTSIDNRAFAKCEALSSVSIPNSVVNLGNAAFYQCTSLESIALPSKLIRIENNAFYECKALKEVTIPSGVTAIGQQSFFGCENLKNIELPEGLMSIEDGAFYNCKSLRSINIPDTVTQIGVDAFEGCNQLEYKYNEGSYAEKYLKENNLLNNKGDDIDVEIVAIEAKAATNIPNTGINTPYIPVTILVVLSFAMLMYIYYKEEKAYTEE